jgi:hypothetical protein
VRRDPDDEQYTACIKNTETKFKSTRLTECTTLSKWGGYRDPTLVMDEVEKMNKLNSAIWTPSAPTSLAVVALLAGNPPLDNCTSLRLSQTMQTLLYPRHKSYDEGNVHRYSSPSRPGLQQQPPCFRTCIQDENQRLFPFARGNPSCKAPQTSLSCFRRSCEMHWRSEIISAEAHVDSCP